MKKCEHLDVRVCKNPDGYCDWCGKYTDKMFYNKKLMLWECKRCKGAHKQNEG